MKIKTWVVWLVVGVFLASEVMLFTASRQKDAAMLAYHNEKERADQLQQQVDDLKSASASTQNAEIIRLRADNQDLPRLRNQVTQLLAARQKLTQQLNATLTAAQQQQAQLEEATEENRQARAAAQEAEAADERNACINNLRQIDAAKQQWALENNKKATAIPAAQDLLPYFKDGTFPVCPSGGTYTINAVGELPACSVPGHVLVLTSQ